MKFRSIQFPHISVFTPCKDIRFVDGVYETDDADEIKTLKTMGFGYDEEDVPTKKTTKKQGA